MFWSTKRLYLFAFVAWLRCFAVFSFLLLSTAMLMPRNLEHAMLLPQRPTPMLASCDDSYLDRPSVHLHRTYESSRQIPFFNTWSTTLQMQRFYIEIWVFPCSFSFIRPSQFGRLLRAAMFWFRPHGNSLFFFCCSCRRFPTALSRFACLLTISCWAQLWL